MAIKKRPIKRKVKVRRPKVSPAILRHRRECDELLELLETKQDEHVLEAMATIVGYDVDGLTFMEQVSKRFDCQITTLQVNAERSAYQTVLTYTDRESKPKHGHLYPRLSVVKTSPRMIQSLMLCYIELCKNLGRFV